MLDEEALAYADTHKLPNEMVARNVIIFIGDGLDIATLGGARLHARHAGGKSPREGLVFDSFPYFGFSKVSEENSSWVIRLCFESQCRLMSKVERMERRINFSFKTEKKITRLDEPLL